MFVTHQFYMWKLGEVNDYLINANSISLNKETALKILLSVTEYEITKYILKPEELDDYNYYKEAGFAIEQSYDLKQNKYYIQEYNKPTKTEIDSPKLIASYVCAQNLDQDVNEINIIISECKGDEYRHKW